MHSSFNILYSFQLSEKKRLKEEEMLRVKEQEKKLEERLKRELLQLNEQYEKYLL